MFPFKSEQTQTVLFDLDGTLIDHFMAIYRCYRYAQERLALEPATYEKVRATVGGSVPVTMRRLVGEEMAEEATALFREHFDAIMLEDLHPLPGSVWVLEELTRRGIRCAIFTNKLGTASRTIAEHLGYSKWLVDTFGTGDTAWRKPEPAFTQHVLEALGARAETTLMVGDSPFDIEAAATAGIPCAAVATGSHTLEELRACEPAPLEAFADLYQLGEALFGLEPRELSEA